MTRQQILGLAIGHLAAEYERHWYLEDIIWFTKRRQAEILSDLAGNKRETRRMRLCARAWLKIDDAKGSE